MPATPSVLLDIADRVAVLTLNRPEKLNALVVDMCEQLLAALEKVAASDARVLVITGAGKAFCAGGDVGFMNDMVARGAGYDELEPLVDSGRAVVSAIAALPIPVLAAVNGVAAGGGANLMLACDVRLASDAARFSQAFVRIGLHTDWGGSYSLPRVTGVARALDLCWTGEMLGAADMLREGLVQRVWPDAVFAGEWRAYAARLAVAPATSVRAARANLRASVHRTLQECLAAEDAAQRACWESGDAAVGVRAFAEKRVPRFADRAAVVPDAAPSAASRRFE